MFNVAVFFEHGVYLVINNLLCNAENPVDIWTTSGTPDFNKKLQAFLVNFRAFQYTKLL